jgi:catechol 2,3-dioxygenase-like lactoylglutathione lyase family enzyme
MLKHVSHVGLWVHDQDEALAFYTEKLGFELRDDVTLAEFGNFRWLTVGPPRQPEVSIILSVPGPPAVDPETAEQVKAMMATGLMGSVILAVEDVRATYKELRARGVEFQQEPIQQSYGMDAALRDPSGNHIRIGQQTQPA